MLRFASFGMVCLFAVTLSFADEPAVQATVQAPAAETTAPAAEPVEAAAAQPDAPDFPAPAVEPAAATDVPVDADAAVKQAEDKTGEKSSKEDATAKSPAKKKKKSLTKKAKATSQQDWLTKHPTVSSLVSLTNAHRARYGLRPVTVNAQMCVAAQNHANWMASTGYFQHSGLPYMEIIFYGPRSTNDAINGWIASPAHHSIMLSGSQVGFGYANRNGTPYWVGVFR